MEISCCIVSVPFSFECKRRYFGTITGKFKTRRLYILSLKVFKGEFEGEFFFKKLPLNCNLDCFICIESFLPGKECDVVCLFLVVLLLIVKRLLVLMKGILV